MNCQQCGMEFERQSKMGKSPKWCSPTCANRAWRRRKRPMMYGEQECVICGSKFIPYAKAQRHLVCSSKCRARRYYLANKERSDARTNQWHSNHKDRLRGYQRKCWEKKPEYYANLFRITEGRRRANLKGKLTPQEWQSVLDLYGHKCLRCGKSEAEVKLTIDHVIPVSQGGSNTIDNVQPLCKSCNASKNARHIDYRKGITA